MHGPATTNTRNWRSLIQVLILVLGLTGVTIGRAEPPDVTQVTAATFPTITGKTWRYSAKRDQPATVFIFYGHDCPMSNGYAEEIKRIYAEFGIGNEKSQPVAASNPAVPNPAVPNPAAVPPVPDKFEFCLVYADRDLTPEAAATHAREYGFTCTAILDPECLLARWTGATKKPVVAVVNAAGELLYRGRIDDRYADFGKRREQLTATELRDALRAIQQGKEIAVPRSTAIGCDIDLPK